MIIIDYHCCQCKEIFKLRIKKQSKQLMDNVNNKVYQAICPKCFIEYAIQWGMGNVSEYIIKLGIEEFGKDFTKYLVAELL